MSDQTPSQLREIFDQISAKLQIEHVDVEEGRMMSRPAITLNGKVFAFFAQDNMVFKLGKDFEPKTHGMRDFEIPRPFKTRPPLYGWFRVFASQSEDWPKFAEQALVHLGSGS